MAECECVPKCDFYNGRMARAMPAAVEIMKQKYCLGDSSQCARYMVRQALGSARVPADLIPTEIEKAKRLIQANAA